MMVALAISFTMVLALIVALICLHYVDGEETPPPEESEEMSSIFPLQTTDEATSASPETDPPPIPDSLLFSSNGDGTCRIIDVGSMTDACVVIPDFSPSGDRVVEIAARAFYGCRTVTAIQIPSSVRVIGELAFADCPNLIYISVSAQSTAFCDLDGVLYTKDLTTLLLYPAMRAGSTATLRAETLRIAPMAFYRCAYLSHVSYLGSAEAWEEISIGEKNYSLTASSKSFLD
jgi:hypothetical protein